MNTKHAIAAAAFATLLSTTPFAVYAAPTYLTQDGMIQTVDEAINAVVHADAARLALFNDDIKTAKAQLVEARADLFDAEKKLNDYTIGDTEDPTNAARYLPFDSTITVSHARSLTREGIDALAQAYKLASSGAKSTVATAPLDDLADVSISVAMLPVSAASDHLVVAQHFLDKGAYFEANIALKAFEDSILMRTYALDSIPQQG